MFNPVPSLNTAYPAFLDIRLQSDTRTIPDLFIFILNLTVLLMTLVRCLCPSCENNLAVNIQIILCDAPPLGEHRQTNILVFLTKYLPAVKTCYVYWHFLLQKA